MTKFHKWLMLLSALVIGANAYAAETSSVKAGEAAKVGRKAQRPKELEIGK